MHPPFPKRIDVRTERQIYLNRHRAAVILSRLITLIVLLAGFNADLGVSLLVKTEGWTDITDWRVAGVSGSLYNANAEIDNDGRFLPSRKGV